MKVLFTVETWSHLKRAFRKSNNTPSLSLLQSDFTKIIINMTSGDRVDKIIKGFKKYFVVIELYLTFF